MVTPDNVAVGEIVIGPSGNQYRVVDVVDNKVVATQLDHFVHNTQVDLEFDAPALSYFRKFYETPVDLK